MKSEVVINSLQTAALQEAPVFLLSFFYVAKESEKRMEHNKEKEKKEPKLKCYILIESLLTKKERIPGPVS